MMKNPATTERRHLLLTGAPGVGKTTLVRAAADAWAASGRAATGFYTVEARGADGRRTGFELVAARDGRRATLATRAAGGRFRVGPFRVDVAAVAAVAVPALEAAPGALLILDEFGKMELLCPAFAPAATAALDAADVAVGTAPSRRGLPAVDALKARADVVLVEVTRANRDRLGAAVRAAFAAPGAPDLAAVRDAALPPPSASH